MFAAAMLSIARPTADGAPAERPVPHRGHQSGQPAAHRRLPADCGAGRPVPDRRGRRRGPPHDRDRADLPAHSGRSSCHRSMRDRCW